MHTESYQILKVQRLGMRPDAGSWVSLHADKEHSSRFNMNSPITVMNEQVGIFLFICIIIPGPTQLSIWYREVIFHPHVGRAWEQGYIGTFTMNQVLVVHAALSSLTDRNQITYSSWAKGLQVD